MALTALDHTHLLFSLHSCLTWERLLNHRKTNKKGISILTTSNEKMVNVFL